MGGLNEYGVIVPLNKSPAKSRDAPRLRHTPNWLIRVILVSAKRNIPGSLFSITKGRCDPPSTRASKRRIKLRPPY